MHKENAAVTHFCKKQYWKTVYNYQTQERIGYTISDTTTSFDWPVFQTCGNPNLITSIHADLKDDEYVDDDTILIRYTERPSLVSINVPNRLDHENGNQTPNITNNSTTQYAEPDAMVFKFGYHSSAQGYGEDAD